MAMESKDLLSMLRDFIAGTSKVSKTDHSKLSETALTLLNLLPAARDAVLEYFCTLYHHSVNKYLSDLEKELKNEDAEDISDTEVVHVIHKILCDYITSNAEAWAPVISSWSLDLLGQISVRNSMPQKNLLLSDRLQLWMACPATRILMEINMQCLQCLMDSNTDSCISALLDKNVLYSPYFDWVVAYVGSCFPQTVIDKVLYCGLKDFGSNEQVNRIAKLNSVVSILAHLANTHFNDIKIGLHNFFLLSLVENVEKIGFEDKNLLAQQIATVPFLLQICSLSPVLLKALSENTLQALNPSLLIKLTNLATDWWSYFDGGRKVMFDLVVHLILNLDKNISHVINLLICTAICNNPEYFTLTRTAEELIELLLSEMDLRQRISDSTTPLIRCVPKEMTSFHKLFLTRDESKLNYITRFFLIIGKCNGQVLSSCIGYLLNNASDDAHVSALMELTSGMYDISFFGNGLSIALLNYNIQNIENHCDSRLCLWKALEKLLKWEQRFGRICKPVLHGLADKFPAIIENLRCYDDIATSSMIASLIYQLLTLLPRHPTTNELFTLTEATVSYLFYSMHEEKDSGKKLKYCQLALRILRKICLSSGVSKMFALRLLIESSLFPPLSSLFGAIIKPDTTPPLGSEHALLKENITHGHTMMVSQHAMSVLHAGIIGSGVKKAMLEPDLTEDEIKNNVLHLMNAIRCCCVSETYQVFTEPVNAFAVSLIHLITPDVSYNNFAWPDEDFNKHSTTVERDVYIRFIFDSTPVIWTFLKCIALHRPAICFTVVLLRSIMATLLAQWTSASQGRHIGIPMTELQKTTILLLEVLSLSQLLMPPLTLIHVIIPHLQPNEVLIIIRECVWANLKDHSPSPALFGKDSNGVVWRDPSTCKPDKKYTEMLRIIMLQNIDKVGSLYYHMFTNVSKET